MSCCSKWTNYPFFKRGMCQWSSFIIVITNANQFSTFLSFLLQIQYMCRITTVSTPLYSVRNSLTYQYIYVFTTHFNFLRIIEEHNFGIKNAVIILILLLRIGVEKLHQHSFTNACCRMKRGGEWCEYRKEYVILTRTLISPK